MSVNSDLIVLGAGPAGTATAIAAAQQGAAVTLIEQSAFPRPRPGESLHPGIAPVLRKLGVEPDTLGFLRYAGQEVRWGGDLKFVPFGGADEAPWLGYQADRAVLDTALLERARQAGVRVLQPCRAHQPQLEAGRVVGLSTSEGDIRGSWVVDAAGGRHWLARHLGQEILRYSPRILVEYGYCTGAQAICDTAPRLEGDSEGWTWLSRIGPERYHWCRLRLTPCRTDTPLLPADFQHLSPTGSPRKSDVTWRIVSAVAGKGYFLAGDAAAVADPLSSHGVLKGILSGLHIAHLLSRLPFAPDNEAAIALEYTDWAIQMFRHDVTHLTRLYKQIAPDFLQARSE